MSTKQLPEEDISSAMLQKRWGEAMADGFVVVPRLLLLKQHDLGLNNGEVVVLLNLLASWWKDEDQPYPAVSTLAQRMGLSLRTVQRTIEQLEETGFIQRLRNTQGNGRSSKLKVTRYELSGMVEKVKRSRRIPTPKRQTPVPSKFNAGTRVTPNFEDMKGPS